MSWAPDALPTCWRHSGSSAQSSVPERPEGIDVHTDLSRVLHRQEKLKEESNVYVTTYMYHAILQLWQHLSTSVGFLWIIAH